MCVDVEIVRGDQVRGRRVVERRDHGKARGRTLEALRPLVALARTRVEVELESFAIMMDDRLPDHLAHDVIAQVRGKIADAQRARPARRRRRQRRAVDPGRDRIVGLRKAQQQCGLDVEEQQQVEQFLEAVGQFHLVAGLVLLAAQAVEIAIEPVEVGLVLARLQRIHGERKRLRTILFERAEVGAPCVDFAGREQHLAQVFVGAHVLRVDRQHLRVGRAGGTVVALLLEQHAQVEVGGRHVRPERQRTLIRARGTLDIANPLQRDAVIEMSLGVGGRQQQRLPERAFRRRAVAPHQVGEAQHPQQRPVPRCKRQALLQHAHRTFGIALRQREFRAGQAGFAELRRRRHGGRERLARLHGIVARQRGLADQLQRGCECRLNREHFPIPGLRRRKVTLLVCTHGRIPDARQVPRRQRTFFVDCDMRVQFAQCRGEFASVGEHALHQRRAVRGQTCRERPSFARGPRGQQAGGVHGQPGGVDQHVTIARGEHFRHGRAGR